MSWGADKTSQFQKHATQTLVLWGDEVKLKGRELGFGFDDITAMEVMILIEAIGLRLAVSTVTSEKAADEIRGMLFDYMKQIRDFAREKHNIQLEPH